MRPETGSHLSRGPTITPAWLDHLAASSNLAALRCSAYGLSTRSRSPIKDATSHSRAAQNNWFLVATGHAL